MNTTILKKENETIKNILLRRKNKVVVAKGQDSNVNHVKALAVNIACLGYVLSPELIKSMETCSVAELNKISKFLVKNLSEMIGAHVQYRPLFRNFPEGVPDTFEYWNQRVNAHFDSLFDITENAKTLSCGHLINTEHFDMSNFGACPICQMQIQDTDLLVSKERKLLSNKIKLKTLDLGEEKEVFQVFTNLLSSTTSISQQDKEDIEFLFIAQKENIVKLFPAEIPNKEVLAFVSSLVLEHLENFDFLLNKIKTATDVLRVAVALSAGDISLAQNTVFRNFSKKERRFLLSMLESCKNIKEDMVRYKGNWIRLGEILHPGDYKKRFPKAFDTFMALRNNVKIETFNSKSENFIKNDDLSSLIKHLKSRPSELARKLDYIISNSEKETQDEATKVFSSISSNVPTTTLLQVMSNFRIRTNKEKGIRIIMPKGNLAKVKVLEDNYYK